MWRRNLNQEALPKGSQLKISENHEVSVGTVFNHLACAQILSSPISTSQEVFYLSKTRGINNRATPILIN